MNNAPLIVYMHTYLGKSMLHLLLLKAWIVLWRCLHLISHMLWLSWETCLADNLPAQGHVAIVLLGLWQSSCLHSSLLLLLLHHIWCIWLLRTSLLGLWLMLLWLLLLWTTHDHVRRLLLRKSLLLKYSEKV